MSREQIPAWVDEYIGIPWAPHGRSRDGCDCWGLLWLVDRERFHFGVPSFDGEYPDDYERACMERLMLEGTMHHAQEVKAGCEQLGDMIALRWAGFPCHVGLVVGERKMLNVRKGIAAVVEPYDNQLWRHKVMGFYRWMH